MAKQKSKLKPDEREGLLDVPPKRPDEDMRHPPKKDQALPNSPEAESVIMAMAMGDVPVRTIYYVCRVGFDWKNLDDITIKGGAVEAFVRRKFAGSKKNGPESQVYQVTTDFPWQTFRTGHELGKMEQIGIQMGLKHNRSVKDIAKLTFRTITDTERVVDIVKRSMQP